MKGNFIVASVFSIAALTGCSATPKNIGKPFSQNKSKSVALNVAAYAGYPYLLKDNSYSKGLDTVVTSTSNALLLANDLSGSVGSIGGGAFGVGLGLMSGLVAQYPLDMANVFTAKLQPGEDYRSATTALRVMKANYQKRAKRADELKALNGFFENPSLDAYVCEPTMLIPWDYSCFDPAYEGFALYVRAIRPATGNEFPQVMPLDKGNYGVFLIGRARGSVLTPKKDAPDAYFYMEKGFYVLGGTNTILPLIAPREDGKRLVFIDGKATLI